MRGCYNTCISIFLEASRVRKEYDDASSKLSKIQSKISTLTEKLKHDFGKCHLKLCSLWDWVLLPVVYYSVATMDSCNFLLHQIFLLIVKSTSLSKFTLLLCFWIDWRLFELLVEKLLSKCIKKLSEALAMKYLQDKIKFTLQNFCWISFCSTSWERLSYRIHLCKTRYLECIFTFELKVCRTIFWYSTVNSFFSVLYLVC